MSLSPTIVFPLVNNTSNSIFKVRTLLDPGSGTNWIAKEVLDKVLYSIVGNEILEVITFNNTVKKKFELVEVYYEDVEEQLVQSLRCYVIKNFTRHIAVRGMVDFIRNNSRDTKEPEVCKLLENMVDPATKNVDHGKENQGIGIILSSSAINKIRTKDKIVHMSELQVLLEPTIFGVAISGKIPGHLRGNIEVIQANCIVPIQANTMVDPELYTLEEETTLRQDIDFIWGQENLGVMPGEVHDNEKIAVDHFIDSVQYDSGTNKYTVSLPWNNKQYLLKDNISVAAGRTRRQQEEMLRNAEYGRMMIKAFKAFVDDDIVERVDPAIPNDNVKYYMPFRGIIKKESSTTSCRMVMDASSKQSASDISLNQALYQGPNLTLDLAICLLQFMLGEYGVVADIEKAFLRILIAASDKDALRFFWFEDPFQYNSKLVVYRFKAVIFGGVCSPFHLAAVLQKLISDECKSLYVKDALLQGTYVDNVVHANDSEQQLVYFFQTSRELLQKGNFNLRKWSSNSPRLMAIARASDVAEESRLVKVLGLFWNLDTDRYLYNTNFEWNKKFNKRSVLQFANRVFDPLGLLTPITIRKRLFLQKLWRKKLHWEANFEFVDNFKDEWLSLVQETHISVTSSFERNAFFTKDTEFHVFSDASKEAYGAVIYARTPSSTECPKGNVHLTFAKGKVAPLDGKQTVPKLELSGATVGARQVPFITKAWMLKDTHTFHFWCDAKVVLYWLSQYNIKNVYVHNRVKDIRCLYNPKNTTVRYVPTAQNPADIITKVQKSKDFVANSEWWNGPKWLLDKGNWPITEKYDMYPEGVVDTVINAFPVAIINVGLTSIIQFFSKFKFEKSLRMLSYLLRAFGYSRRTLDMVEEYSKDSVCKEELDRAKLVAIKIMQRDMFVPELQILKENKEVTKGPCRKWHLYLDSDGIIRCKGRLLNPLEPRSKHNPILVHGKHPFVEGFIAYRHKHSNCSSRSYTLHKVRREMHGPSLTVAVNKIVRQCNACRILRARHYDYPEMPALPNSRLAAEKPFAICGVDYSGPHNVKFGRGRKKVWIALFTCMVSRAVHLETVPDLTSEAFLQALQKLAWHKGTPRVLMSDNATTFVRANKLLMEIHDTQVVKDSLAIKGIAWTFTPTRAPWFGAVYERLIGVLKKELIKLIGNSLITLHEMNCHLAEVEYIINSRPLIKVGQA